MLRFSAAHRSGRLVATPVGRFESLDLAALHAIASTRPSSFIRPRRGQMQCGAVARRSQPETNPITQYVFSGVGDDMMFICRR